jgi:hypothetical protein
MKHTITIQLEVEMDDYSNATDTEAGAVDLAVAMIFGDADFPEQISVKSGDAVKLLSFW